MFLDIGFSLIIKEKGEEIMKRLKKPKVLYQDICLFHKDSHTKDVKIEQKDGIGTLSITCHCEQRACPYNVTDSLLKPGHAYNELLSSARRILIDLNKQEIEDEKRQRFG